MQNFLQKICAAGKAGPERLPSGAVFAALGDDEPEYVEGCGVAAGGQAFGMELHSPYRTAVDALDGFHDGVGGGPGGHSEAGGYVLGGLVVGGVDHICSGAGYVSEPRASYRVDGVNGPEVGEGLVVVGLRRFLGGDVLVEGASEGYVDQLLAPAYAEDRYAAGGSSPDEVEVVAVTESVDSS